MILGADTLGILIRGSREELMQWIAHGRWLTLVVPLIVPGLGFPQAEQKGGMLIVSGHPGQAPVTHIDGRPYVAVDALARLMNGSLGYLAKPS